MSLKPVTNMSSVAYLGPKASFSHQATLNIFPPDQYNHQPCVDIHDIFHAVQSSNATFGVVPFENSSNGSVIITLDLFCDRKSLNPSISVCAETFLPVHHCLLGRPRGEEEFETSLKTVTKIFSHPQAFGQCETFLSKHLKGVERINVSSTSRAAELAAQDETAVAIGSAINVEFIKDIEILHKDIEDVEGNTTRFLVITRAPVEFDTSLEIRHKYFLAFNVEDDQPGALSNVLNVFKKYNLNLTSLHSRPSLVHAWTYTFLVEFEEDSGEKLTRQALEEMEKFCVKFKVLGRYESKTPVRQSSRE